ncbi:MAG: hypothetical protein KF901_15895 [Myxococcales bacterium]|nr:hypothetical protein [Myxococcales bacterium]
MASRGGTPRRELRFSASLVVRALRLSASLAFACGTTLPEDAGAHDGSTEARDGGALTDGALRADGARVDVDGDVLDADALDGDALDADASTGDDAGPGGSRCDVSAARITCAQETATLDAGGFSRTLYFQTPLGAAPAAGWPAVLLFHGAFVEGRSVWRGERLGAFGAYWQTDVVRALLDAGFAVLTPLARDGAWDTNLAPWRDDWPRAPDHALMRALFDAIDRGDLGPLDGDRLFATGLSSGGYMSSRVALAYPGRVRAIAIASASYMTCGGAFCAVPTLAGDHPPTLFLHGERDGVVPIGTMRLYEAELARAGVTPRVVVDRDADHEWLRVSASEITAFFGAHR